MPFDAEGRGSVQLKRGETPEWLCGKLPPRADLETIPFTGAVTGETPALPKWCVDEVRRKDVGRQRYGGGKPTQTGSRTNVFGMYDTRQKPAFASFATSHGDLALSSSREKHGFLPSADAVDFLRSTLGTRLEPPPQRFFQ